MCREMLRGCKLRFQSFDPIKLIDYLSLERALKGSRSQITKVAPNHKMGPINEHLQLFHLESTQTYENLYNDPFGLVNHLVNYIVAGVRQEEAPHLYLHHMINEQISTPSQIKLRVVLR